MIRFSPALRTFLFTLAVAAALIYLIGYFVPSMAHDLAIAAIAHATVMSVEQLTRLLPQFLGILVNFVIQVLRALNNMRRV